MTRAIGFAVLTLVGLWCAVSPAAAQGAEAEERAKEFVHKQYLDGIPYQDARALGKEAVPHLVSLLGDPREKEHWVNVIVTLGFLEDSSALPALESFLENASGEVDLPTFRALLSVHYAIGCLAANGDTKAYDSLRDGVRGAPAARWSFGGRDVDHLLAQRRILGLAVSGLPAARLELQRVKEELGKPGAAGASARAASLRGTVDDGLGLMDRIHANGRAAAFNPGR